jgi:1-phosphatidylinositol-4-phosphate 5-kinase
MMPSFAGDSSAHSTTLTSSVSSAPHLSAAKPPLGSGYALKLPNGDLAKMNGKTPNGNGAMQAVPNGRLSPPAASEKGLPHGEGRGRSLRTEDHAPYIKAAEARGTSGDMPSRDDGYFASVHSSEQQDGCRTTKVHLGTFNTQESKSAAQKDFIAPSKHSSESATAHHPQQQAYSSSDASLQVPNSSYRVSSPAAFNHSSPAPGPPPNRAQQRHTLEVPRASTARSRDTQTSHNSADDVVTATGRFSPNTPTRRRGSMSLVRRTTRSVNSDMHLEEVPQDEDAARWAEHIRQKRASKRKRKEDEDDDRVLVGTKVDQTHTNWITAYNMLTGIRFCVSRTNAKMDRDLTDADFGASHKFSFDM